MIYKVSKTNIFFSRFEGTREKKRIFRTEACELNHLVFDTSDNEEEDEENIETNLVDKKVNTD